MRKSAIIETYLDQTLTSPGGRQLPSAPFHVFGTVTPDGPADWDELRLKQQVTLGHLAAMNTSAEPGYAIGSIQSWVEPVVFAHGICDRSALSFALDRLLEFHVAVRADSVEAFDRWGNLRGRGPLRVPDATGVCVMPNPEPGEVCVMRGGPYGSRAMAASADWAEQRIRLIAALGCETCEQGRVFRFGADRKLLSGGGPISVVGHPVVTRYTAELEVTNV